MEYSEIKQLADILFSMDKSYFLKVRQNPFIIGCNYSHGHRSSKGGKKMGFWQTEHGLGGDSWADALDSCMHELSARKVLTPHSETECEEAHEITMAEFGNLVEFCTRGHLKVEVRHPEHDSGRPLSELHCWGVETYSNQGQIHCPELCAV